MRIHLFRPVLKNKASLTACNLSGKESLLLSLLFVFQQLGFVAEFVSNLWSILEEEDDYHLVSPCSGPLDPSNRTAHKVNKRGYAS